MMSFLFFVNFNLCSLVIIYGFRRMTCYLVTECLMLSFIIQFPDVLYMLFFIYLVFLVFICSLKSVSESWVWNITTYLRSFDQIDWLDLNNFNFLHDVAWDVRWYYKHRVTTYKIKNLRKACLKTQTLHLWIIVLSFVSKKSWLQL